MEKSLKYFMRDNSEEVVTVPGIESFKNEKGEVINFEIKKLSNEHIRKIQEKYRVRTIATDSKGNPYTQNGEVVYAVTKDNNKSLCHVMAEAFVYPDLKSKEMMDFYKCADVTEMPTKVFFNTDEFNKAANIVMRVLGMIDAPSAEEEIDAAKN